MRAEGGATRSNSSHNPANIHVLTHSSAEASQ